jgi:putative membrane protein
VRPGLRILSPVITMTPQILVGAIITFSSHDLYPIFDLCGRAFGLPPLIDQSLGGLIMWVPAAFIEAIGSMIALRNFIRLSEQGRLPERRWRAAAAATAAAAAARAATPSPSEMRSPG